MNKSTECPNCENQFPHVNPDHSYYCEECGKEWTVELPTVDEQLLELARQMIPLMKAKGFKDTSEMFGVEFITVNLWHDKTIEVECIHQDIKTTREKL